VYWKKDYSVLGRNYEYAEISRSEAAANFRKGRTIKKKLVRTEEKSKKNLEVENREFV
jgi:hypothetical protein